MAVAYAATSGSAVRQKRAVPSRQSILGEAGEDVHPDPVHLPLLGTHHTDLDLIREGVA